MFDKWELSFFPSDREKNRWKLSLKISDDELDKILKKIRFNISEPYSTLNPEYNWILYIHDLSDDAVDEVVKLLKQCCKNGEVKKEQQKKDIAKVKEGEHDLRSFVEEVLDGLKPEPASPVEKHVTEIPEPQPGQEIPKINDAAGEKLSKFIQMTLNPMFTFEEFVVGSSNRFTQAAALAVSQNLGKVYNPLFIYGGVGLGKTHLMQAIGNYVKEKNPQVKILYITSEQFVNEVIDSLRGGTLQEFRNKYRDADLLLVDDVQFLSESESTQEEFFHTFNILHQNNRQIVLTSDKPPKRLVTLEDRLKSRFEWGLIADIKSPTLETRVAILKRKEEHEKLNLDDNILLYIASKLKSNVRELEGFLKRINAYATITGQPANIELIKNIMKELLPEEETIPGKPEEMPVPPPVQPLTPAPQTPSAPTMPTATAVEPDLSLKPVEVAFFYPEGKDNENIVLKNKFQEVINKHKLNFRLESIFERPYDCSRKINYQMFIELCKTNHADIAIVLGPYPESDIKEDGFSEIIIPLMDSEIISLQYMPWRDLRKDYRYLNLALDITLSKHKLLK